MGEVDKEGVKEYLLDLQERICVALEGEDGSRFQEDSWEREGFTRKPRPPPQYRTEQ